MKNRKIIDLTGASVNSGDFYKTRIKVNQNSRFLSCRFSECTFIGRVKHKAVFNECIFL